MCVSGASVSYLATILSLWRGAICHIYAHDAVYTLSTAGGLITSRVYTCIYVHVHTHTHTHTHTFFFFFFLINSIITTNIMWLQKLRSHNTDAVPVSSVENKAHLVQHVTSRRKVYNNGWEDGGCCAGKKTY